MYSSFDKQYLCYLLLGVGTLAPWNAFITAADYYALRYPVSSSFFPLIISCSRPSHPHLFHSFSGVSCRPSAHCLLLAGQFFSTISLHICSQPHPTEITDRCWLYCLYNSRPRYASGKKRENCTVFNR